MFNKLVKFKYFTLLSTKIQKKIDIINGVELFLLNLFVF